MMVSLGKKQYTSQGIKENHSFRINLPGKNIVTETDYSLFPGGTRTRSGSSRRSSASPGTPP